MDIEMQEPPGGTGDAKREEDLTAVGTQGGSCGEALI